MLKQSVMAVLALTSMLAACAQTPGWQDSTLTGANGGAPNNVLSPIKPNAVLDDGDRAAEASAERRAFVAPIGQQVTWNNPQNDHAGTITPLRDGYDAAGTYCREFRQTTTVGGQNQQSYAKACQQPDGSWKIVQ